MFLRTLFLYACALSIYFTAYYTLHTVKNIWTIISVLGILPASKSLVNLIMFMRFRSLDSSVYEEYKDAFRDLCAIYEIPFTTYEKTYFAEAVVCRNNTVAGYCGPSGKREDKKVSADALAGHLESVLVNGGFDACTVKIFDDRQEFLKRAGQMRENLEPKEPERDRAILNCLLSVGL